jgi:urease subunit alpha
MGDPNASIPTPQPVHYRPMFGASAARCRRPRHHLRLAKASLADAAGRTARRASAGAPVIGTPAASARRHDPERRLPHIEVDPETYEVRADGELLTCEPAASCPRPMAAREGHRTTRC